jgi:hypothetical protein
VTGVIFLEDHARLLLLLHTALAVAAVASSTHLVLWIRKVRRGRAGLLRAARRFAFIAAALHLATFVAGNLMYPTYKVRVKVAYLQRPDAVESDASARAELATDTARRYAPSTPSEAREPSSTAPNDADRVARWFDAKEHWVAMGLALALALAFVLPVWKPEPGEGAEIGSLVQGLAIAACASLWFGAIVGVVTASWRAVG